MKSDEPLDYAVFQLSPKHSRCELFVSSDGDTEKIASGLLKPFVSHLQIAEEQLTSTSKSLKLEVGRQKNAKMWFKKGTLERFVRFVSTPEVLELVNTFDAETSQLEAARRIYSQGAGDQLSGGGGTAVKATDDATKKELLRAIDVRLTAVKQDLSTACARAAAAGFNIDTVSELQMFADRFGAHRLNEACVKFISISDKRPELIQPWKSGPDDRTLRSSYGSDMSIDDDPTSPPPQPNPAPLSRDPSVDREESKKPEPEKDQKAESSTPDQTVSISASQPTRRLSVQDRISMFENKQKENSGGKPAVVVKPVELRRLSSDVSASGGVAAEKAVLRRWSGASDMSIDLSADKKDTEIPSSTVVSQESKALNSNDDTIDLSSVAKTEIKMSPSLSRVSDNKSKGVSINNSEMLSESNKFNSNLGSGENDGLKDQLLGKTTQSRSFRAEDQDFPENNHKTSTGGKTEEREKFSGSQARDESTKKVHNKATQKTAIETRVLENDADSKLKRIFATRYKGTEADSSSAQKDVRSVDETEVAENRVPYMSERVSSVQDTGPQRLKFSRQAELNKKARVQRDESSFSGSSKTQFSGKVETEAQESIDSFSTPPPDQVQRIRQSKGNQELNDELKVKASELEKLFAEHKSRAPTDQSNSSTRKETQLGSSSNSHSTKPASVIAPPQSSDSYQSTEPTSFSKNMTKSNFASPVKTVDAINKNFSELHIQEGSRGKLYDMYMQKRNAKLREEWSSNGAEKEARLKSMQDSLERNRSEMKAKISGSADRQDLASSAHQRAERLRSYNSKLILKRDQQDLDFADSDNDDEALDVTKGKKHLPNNRSLSSTTPRTSAAPIPKSATKNYANPGKRRMQIENPLAQSVPNFSELRKDNAKPSSGTSKPTRPQVRNYPRSKSTNEEAANIAREDNKSRRSQSLRKSSANPSNFGEISTLDSDSVNLTPIKFDVEVMKNIQPKTFLKKGSRASFVSQTSIAREKASLVSEFIKDEEENDDDVESVPDEFASAGKNELDEEFEALSTEDQSILESEKLITIESENGDITNRALESQLLTVDSLQDWPEESPVSWNYTHRQNPFSYPHEMSDVDSPGGSPASWNSNSFNQTELDSSRMRKKWGTAQKPMLVAQSSNNLPRKDMKTGFKRLLKFGRKSRGSDILVDWISATTSEGDDDTEDGRDSTYRSSEDLRKSRMGFSSHTQPSDDSYNESEFFNESVRSSEISISAAPANFKLRDDHISGSSIKAPRSFFSLSTFRSKGSDSKLR
ncbi:hypothetical protein CASFOL_038514 [Castilleja foliolosa]|uniref:COP1-interacting protein 7 n=1 Tax=Castilleja foliolosa TaxID=1961234 RepID=A0ABD3BL67_9LAMI